MDQAPAGAAEYFHTIFRPCRGCCFWLDVAPRLKPWATFYRRSAAGDGRLPILR